MTLKDRLKAVVNNLRKQQEIKTNGVQRAKRMAEAAKRVSLPK